MRLIRSTGTVVNHIAGTGEPSSVLERSADGLIKRETDVDEIKERTIL